MQLTHAMVGLENSVATQVRMGGAELVELSEQLLEVLRPAIRQTLMDVVEAAATEVSSQLRGQTVEVRVREGEPELIVTDQPGPAAEKPDNESMEARITLRLPDYLKALIEDEADSVGDSVNTWVVDVLRNKAGGSTVGSSVKTTIDL